MIFITAKFLVRPEEADRWPEFSHDFTQATQSEPGCMWAHRRATTFSGAEH
jgi:quinol monooxygenase YgiN